MSKIYKHSERDFINSLFDQEDNSSSPRKTIEEIKKASLADMQEIHKAKHFDDLNPDSLNSHTVIPSGHGGIKDIGQGPETKTATSRNSIFDNENLQKLASKETDYEKMIRSKREREERRKAMKQAQIDENLKEASAGDIRKDSSVFSLSDSASGSPKSNRSIGLFGENDEFSAVPKLTKGESLSRRKTEANKKDDSWKETKGQKTSESLLDNFIDSILEKDAE